MSLERTYDDELAFQLIEAGLPSNPDYMIELKFQFGCKNGSHHHILVGTIEAIMISDEGGLELQVSNDHFGTWPLISLYRDPDKGEWNARVDAPDPADRYYVGELKIYWI